MTDRRQFAPATERNRGPILSILKDHLPDTGTVLEIASGSGEHAVFFAPALRPLNWQPSNYDPEQLDSVEDWLVHQPSDNLLPAISLDVTKSVWPVETSDYGGGPITAIFNANMIHISPWQACEGQHTAPSNEKFETWLKSLDPDFAVRDIEVVCDEARKNGLEHMADHSMPANNYIHIFKKT